MKESQNNLLRVFQLSKIFLEEKKSTFNPKKLPAILIPVLECPTMSFLQTEKIAVPNVLTSSVCADSNNF